MIFFIRAYLSNSLKFCVILDLQVIHSILEPTPQELTLLSTNLETQTTNEGLYATGSVGKTWERYLVVEKKSIFWDELYQLDCTGRVREPAQVAKPLKGRGLKHKVQMLTGENSKLMEEVSQLMDENCKLQAELDAALEKIKTIKEQERHGGRHSQEGHGMDDYDQHDETMIGGVTGDPTVQDMERNSARHSDEIPSEWDYDQHDETMTGGVTGDQHQCQNAEPQRRKRKKAEVVAGVTKLRHSQIWHVKNLI